MKQKYDWFNTPAIMQKKALERKDYKLHYWTGGSGSDKPLGDIAVYKNCANCRGVEQ